MENATSTLANLNQSLVPGVGQQAIDFSLLSIQGESIQLKKYNGKQNIVLWFSRGFTCPNCRGFMEIITEDYDLLRANNIEIIQISPNLYQSAVNFFGDNPPPYPMVCDPDKRLFATYSIGDKGKFKATTNAINSFAAAAKIGQFNKTVRAAYMDVADRSFLQRLHHHAMTALNQSIIAIDLQSIIRYRMDVDALGGIPTAPQMVKFLQKEPSSSPSLN